MYYLLKLEAVSLKGRKVVDKRKRPANFNLSFVDFNANPIPCGLLIDTNTIGHFWDGSLFERIGDKFKDGDILPDNVYEIICQPFMFISDVSCYDEISNDLEINFEEFLGPDVEAWADKNKPIVFLMEFYSYSTWTTYGEEWDTTHYLVKTLDLDDLKKLS